MLLLYGIATLSNEFYSRRNQKRNGQRRLNRDFLTYTFAVVVIRFIADLVQLDFGYLAGRLVVEKNIERILAGMEAGFAKIGFRLGIRLADFVLKVAAFPVCGESLICLQFAPLVLLVNSMC